MSIQLNLQANRGDFCLDVNINIPCRGVTMLFGPSGSGKTTCLRAMAGLERLANSYVSINGDVWQDEPHHIWRPSHQRDIGYVFQEASLFSHLNVKQNLLFGYRRIAANKRKVTPEETCQLLGITGLLSRNTASLSGGERQRVAIARALLTSPKLLLMDEPLSALDLKLKQEIMPYLERLHQHLSIPVVYVSHALEEVASLADYVVMLNQGKVALAGKLNELMLDKRAGLLFGGQANTLLTGQVVAKDRLGLSTLRVQGLLIYVAGQHWRIGETVRCRVNARDVSLCNTKPDLSSIVNVLPAMVQSIDKGLKDGECLVTSRLASGQLLQALISEYSTALLALKCGQSVWLQLKSVAII
ncbi:molybdenum ABC transporter ATP-binding protein [Agarivorans sp. MS3-6]|uniref:molybdenum ABC transporter ATP-binding protein n=1 Tax=Agarivorans sp. TSD2052 TaxID=2937286 RepID=UPI00200F11C4|nr:molybdenum ABC transporter ATP-binding protein [Agarivorans sp. TSD2052]UPW20316.1 molybdenum ABC transporter ATP-binding protein [Agarivorans sp. TSD2052]